MSQNDDIIDDLMRKYPRGPEGITVTYTEVMTYSHERHIYFKFQEPSISGYGYSDDELFNLGFVSRSEVEGYLRSRDFADLPGWKRGGRQSTLTRRTNNVWYKLKPSIEKVRKEGRKGIYKVSGKGYMKDIFGHIYAETLDEAQQNANLFFGYLSSNDALTVSFSKIGNVDLLTSMNKVSQESIEGQIINAVKYVDEQQMLIENLNARLSTLRIVEQQQIAVEMVHAVEAAANARIEREEDQNEQSL